MPSLLSCRCFRRSRRTRPRARAVMLSRSPRTRPRGFHRAITVTIPTSDHGRPARSLARWLAMLLDCCWLLQQMRSKTMKHTVRGKPGWPTLQLTRLGHPGLSQDDGHALARVVMTMFRFKSFLVCVALRCSASLCGVVSCLVSTRLGLCQCLPALHVINPCGDECSESYWILCVHASE